MNKKVILAALSFAVLVSCTKSEFEGNEQMIFHAGFGPSTKTELTSSYAVNWKSGDAISVNGNRFSTDQSGEVVDFTGDKFEADAYLAVYPFESAQSINVSGKSALVTIPSVQVPHENTFDPMANVSMAYSADNNFHFKNVGALLCIDLTKYQNITKVVVAPAGAEQKLSGQVTVSLDESNIPVVSDKSNAVAQVELSYGEKIIAPGKYYVVVAPGLYPEGLKVTLTNSSGETGDFPFTSLTTLERARLYTLALENENYFTYFRYGNNLGLPNDGTYPSQFLAITKSGTPTLDVKGTYEQSTDCPYPVGGGLVLSNTKFLSAFGKIRDSGNFNVGNSQTTAKFGYILVKATAGTGIKAFTVTEPVFTLSVTNPQIVFKPFVVKANPQTGGSTPVNLELDLSIDRSKLIIDWRRKFKYYNVGGPASHKDGTLAAAGAASGVPSYPDMMLAKIWSNYYTAIGVTPNYGSNDPIYWYTNNSNNRTPNSPLYLEPTDAGFNAVVNPEKWYIDGEYANGIFTGEMTYVTNGDRRAWASGTPLSDPFFVYIAK